MDGVSNPLHVEPDYSRALGSPAGSFPPLWAEKMKVLWRASTEVCLLVEYCLKLFIMNYVGLPR